MLRALADYVDREPKRPTELERYQSVKLIRNGSNSSLTLMKEVKTEKLYVLKTTDLTFVHPSGREATEVNLRALISLKTIIHLTALWGFKDENTLYDVMECAEGGSMHEEIEQYTREAKLFTSEEVKDFFQNKNNI